MFVDLSTGLVILEIILPKTNHKRLFFPHFCFFQIKIENKNYSNKSHVFYFTRVFDVQSWPKLSLLRKPNHIWIWIIAHTHFELLRYTFGTTKKTDRKIIANSYARMSANTNVFVANEIGTESGWSV